MQGLLDETARAKQRLAEIAPLLPFRTTIHDLETARRHWDVLDGQAAASKVAELTGAVKQVREHLPKPGGKQVSAAVALRTAGTVRELQEVLKRWYSFYDGYQPDFAWWLKKPYEDASKQLDEYGKYLREEIAQVKGKDEDPLVGQPIGAEALAAGIRREWLPYTADELIAVGEREFAWCEGEMKKAANEMKLGDDWKAALARVKADYVPPGQQDELVARIAREATDFVKRRDLVTVPRLCEESWGLTMISPEAVKTIPYAAYNGRQMLVAYCQRRDETGRQADGHAGQQPPLHAAGHSARADPRASPAAATTRRAVRSGPFPRPFTWKAGPCIGNCGCGTWAGRERPRTASACSSGG